MPEPLALYVHIPFCTARCGYCDFNTYAGQESLIGPYTRALAAEADLWSEPLRDRPVTTVFFGGGTPSLLPLAELAAALAALRGAFAVARDAEVTLEANPGTLSAGYLRGVRDRGVNRLSVGVQSFDDGELRWLERIHSSAEVYATVDAARAAGFDNLNLDLIFGLPGQAMTSWERSLAEAVRLRPEHLSLYALTVEEGTPLALDVARGRKQAPDPDTQAAMYERGEELLAANGYRQYEISNWSLPGRECRHNLAYWQDRDWLGLGAGAHSHLDGVRFACEKLPSRYISKVREAVATPGCGLERMRQVCWAERPSREMAMADMLILGLRLVEGADLAEFRRRFGVDARREFAGAIAAASADGLLEVNGERLRLTGAGRLLANEALVRFLPEPAAVP